MSKINNLFKKVAPDIIELGIKVIRHTRDNDGLSDIDVDEAYPLFDLEADIKRLENDPFFDIARELEANSDLNLGYSSTRTVRTSPEDLDEGLSHVGQKSPRPPQVVGKQEYGGDAKSFAGQSDVDYCIECAVKHGNGAKVLMREALQRAEAADPSSQGVLEKVRGVTEELTGVEHDTDTVGHPGVMALNTMARVIRKQIYTSGAEIGRASKEDIQGIKVLIDELVDAAYLAREAQEEDCPSCRHAVGISMSLNVGKSLGMPDVDELASLIKSDQVDPVEAMEAIINHARTVNDEDAVDYLTGVKKMMTEPL